MHKFIFSIAPLGALADLPVHCVWNQAQGVWHMELSETKTEHHDCDHRHPDVAAHEPDSFPNGMNLLEKFNITLMARETDEAKPLSSRVHFGDVDTGNNYGNWTMIYDEAVEINLPPYRFLSFFKFENGKADSSDLEVRTANSICSESGIGWYTKQEDDGSLSHGCWRGKNAGPKQEEPWSVVSWIANTVSNVVGPSWSFALRRVASPASTNSWSSPVEFSVDKQRKAKRRLQRKIERSSRQYAHQRFSQPLNPLATSFMQGGKTGTMALEMLPGDFKMQRNDMQRVVNNLNARSSGMWEAGVYDMFVGKSVKDLNSFAGINRPHRSSITSEKDDIIDLVEEQEEFQAARSLKRNSGSSFMQTGSFAHSFDLSQWQHGTDEEEVTVTDFHSPFLEPVGNQGACGSCFAFASIRMMTARRRHMLNHSKMEPFSTSFPLMCSEYNQGCKGGYAFLVARWSKDVGLVPESAAHYQTDACRINEDWHKSKQGLWRVSNYGYVGGFYGAVTPDMMVRQLYHKGPLVASFEPIPAFMFYQRGVFDVPSQHQSHHQNWTVVDHSVLLTGFGVDTKNGDSVPYWRLQNSWSSDWGEHGYFRLLRKENLLGIESIVVFADVEKVPADQKGSHIKHVNNFIQTHADIQYKHVAKSSKQRSQSMQRDFDYDEEEVQEGFERAQMQRPSFDDDDDDEILLTRARRHFQDKIASPHKTRLNSHYAFLEDDEDDDNFRD